MRLSLIVTVPLLLLQACTTTPPADRPIADAAAIHQADGTTNPAARGVWQSSANGWLLDVGAEGITRWQDTPVGCYRAGPGSDAAVMGSIEYRFFTSLGRDRAIFQYLPGDTPTRFVRLSSLPSECGSSDLSGEEAVFDTFAAIMARHYGFFDERAVEWQARVGAVRPTIHDGMGEAALFDAMGALVEGLSDSHTKLIATVEGERRRAQGGLGTTLPMVREGQGEGAWVRGLVEQLLEGVLDPGARLLANDRMVAGTLQDGRVGYLQIFTMGGFVEGPEAGSPAWAAAEIAAFDAAMDEVLGGFVGAEALILDLSNNRGGYDVIARRIAERLTDSAYLGYTVTHTGGGEAVPYLIEVAAGARFGGPVYLLTSDVTVSGGELATLALRQNGNVIHAGSTTRGSFSTPLAKPLPNGWYLELSNEAFRAPDGALYEGRGIAPQWPVEVFPENAPVAGHARAIEWLAAAATSQAD
ncbi:S41 family peptidase [Aurantiacibacter sp. MUD11]|uniref:S41 family peptidase n=1 Tax=Aurantiacibacter sp. MUD11 TaxID=3003265 RepID=UPI0022AA812B|nr:S41 family peptidase [Aurantiacibacter sp. MUD11]WAT17392.1 S41 family peptidase [Aurantiacibacter sp. MUD11]